MSVFHTLTRITSIIFVKKTMMNSRESYKNKSKDELIDIILDLNEKLALLMSTVSELQQEIQRLKKPKNSRNSSLPPSQDLFRFKNQSLREKSNKKSGGQPGHKGETLNMSAEPDYTFKHYPNEKCPVCGQVHDVSEFTEIAGRRQVIDIPIVKAIVTEHLAYRLKCTCGHVNEGSFPSNVSAPVQYGNNISSFIAYLSARQYVPMSRLSELVHSITNISISQGTIYNILNRVSDAMLPLYEGIKNNIYNATTVGGDETGLKVNNKNYWAWVWQTLQETFIVVSENRGYTTVAETFPDGLPNAIYVSDSLSAQLKIKTKSHQLCLAHITRELNFFIDKYQCSWASEMKALLKSSMELKQRMPIDSYSGEHEERADIIEKFADLIKHPLWDNIPKLPALQKRLIKHQHHMFNFLFYPDVPFDNNGSERAIRNIKVKQNVYGSLRSDRGAEIFAIIRSVVDTFIKRGSNPLSEISFAVNLATSKKTFEAQRS